MKCFKYYLKWEKQNSPKLTSLSKMWHTILSFNCFCKFCDTFSILNFWEMW